MKRGLILLMLCFTGGQLMALDVWVRLFSDRNLTEVTVQPDSGLFHLIAYNHDFTVRDTVYDAFAADDESDITLTKKGNYINVKVHGADVGTYPAVQIFSADSQFVYRIKGYGKERKYYGDLQLRPYEEFLQVVNKVNLEKYVAGVVESEAGHVDELEFYKAQAVLARTFALKNLRKHWSDGYNLKDDVTSQVYFSKARYKNAALIEEAVRATRDTVLVTMECEPILGAFHANSGGFTVDAKDAWLSSVDYLVSRPDSFSINTGSYHWEKRIPKNKYYNYFARMMGVSNDANLHKALLNFDQEQRQSHFTYKGKSLKLTKVRFDFGLKSTYFSTEEEGNYIVLNGNGYGHGVGLSQDGAIIMSEKGYNYRDILCFYFTDVDFEAVKFADIVQ